MSKRVVWGRIAGLAVIGATLVGVATACSGAPNAQQAEQKVEQHQQWVYNQNQPIPLFKWSLERQILIDSEVAAARGDQSTSFFMLNGVRDPVYVCPSLGLGVPDTSQLSNPQQIAPISGKWGGGATTLPQADPFGIHTPATSDGTFVICLIGGKPVLQRAEEIVHTIMAPAVWDYSKHVIKTVGGPTTKMKTKPEGSLKG